MMSMSIRPRLSLLSLTSMRTTNLFNLRGICWFRNHFSGSLKMSTYQNLSLKSSDCYQKLSFRFLAPQSDKRRTENTESKSVPFGTSSILNVQSPRHCFERREAATSWELRYSGVILGLKLLQVKYFHPPLIPNSPLKSNLLSPERHVTNSYLQNSQKV